MSAADPLGFLGEEFLTWLWFRIETEGGDFDLGRDRHVGVSFDDFIAFAPLDNDETEQTLRKGSPSRCAEAAAALRNGRRLTRARLVLAPGASRAPEAGELRRYLGEHVAQFKLPRQFEVVTALPKTASGKLLRRS